MVSWKRVWGSGFKVPGGGGGGVFDKVARRSFRRRQLGRVQGGIYMHYPGIPPPPPTKYT